MHLPLGEQVLLLHWLPAVQSVPVPAPQVFVATLQVPVEHTTDVPSAAQVPSCRPSLGNEVPGVSWGTQALLARSQYEPPLQSMST